MRGRAWREGGGRGESEKRRNEEGGRGDVRETKVGRKDAAGKGNGRAEGEPTRVNLVREGGREGGREEAADSSSNATFRSE